MEDNKIIKYIDSSSLAKPAISQYANTVNILNSTVLHESRIQVEQISGSARLPIKIQSLSPIFKDNTMTKVAKLYIDGQIIKITDTFSNLPVEPLSSVVKNQQEAEECQIRTVNEAGQGKYSRRLLKVKGYEHDKRDVRSTVKNIFRIFKKWVDFQTPIELRLEQALNTILKRMGKYNNKLIVEISKHPQLRKAFITFCEEDGISGINRSRITDKASHHEALREYMEICLQEDQQQQIVELSHQMEQNPVKMQQEK